MSNVIMRPATEADCVALAPHLRTGDLAEIASTSQLGPLGELRSSLAQSSHAVTAALPDGRIICMFGVGSIGFLSTEGSPWLVGSDLVDVHWREFVRRSRKYLGAMLELYPTLANAIDARQADAIRWLRWLGFSVSQPIHLYGDHGPMICPFTIDKPELGQLSVRAFAARDLKRIAANPVFERPSSNMVDLAAVERLPSFTGEVDGRVVACAGVVPHDGALEAWAYFAAGSRPLMVSLFNACRRFLNDCGGPVRALVDVPSERWARLLGFRPTGSCREVNGRHLPIYVRE
jgi:hypothetical protein